MQKLNRTIVFLDFGFTLIELMIVVAIIAILAMVMIPAYQGYNEQPHKPPPPPSILVSADEAISKLELQNLVHTTPDKIELGSSVVFQLALGGGNSIEELNYLIEKAGDSEGFVVRVSNLMSANLTGDQAFDIRNITPDTQIVSKVEPTVWKWQITANKVGVHELHIALNAILNLDNSKQAKNVLSYSKYISVEVTSFSGVMSFVESYWQYIAALISVLFGSGLIWKLKSKQKELKEIE